MSKKRAGERIAELREQGYTVKVKQLRQACVGFSPFGLFRMDEIRDRRQQDSRLSVHPRGGQTEVAIITPNGLVVTGEARCRQDDYTKGGKWREGDIFNKNIGLTIALNRALLKLRERETTDFIKPSENGGYSHKMRVG